MTTYDISVDITADGKDVLTVNVSRETLHLALTAATAAARAGVDHLLAAADVTPRYDQDKPTPRQAYCLTHDLMWNDKAHDAQAWCSTRYATEEEIAGADSSVEDREFTSEPLEIEQMQQRVKDEEAGLNAQVLHGIYTQPDDTRRIVLPDDYVPPPPPSREILPEHTIYSLPDDMQPRTGQRLTPDSFSVAAIHRPDRVDFTLPLPELRARYEGRFPPGQSLSEGQERIYGPEQ